MTTAGRGDCFLCNFAKSKPKYRKLGCIRKKLALGFAGYSSAAIVKKTCGWFLPLYSVQMRGGGPWETSAPPFLLFFENTS